MSAAHTPGPWLCRKDSSPAGYWIQSAGKHSMTINQHIKSVDEAEANARLIAAAPDLLNMLTRLLSEVCMTEAGMSHVSRLTLEHARAALAKAQGIETKEEYRPPFGMIPRQPTHEMEGFES